MSFSGFLRGWVFSAMVVVGLSGFFWVSVGMGCGRGDRCGHGDWCGHGSWIVDLGFLFTSLVGGG